MGRFGPRLQYILPWRGGQKFFAKCPVGRPWAAVKFGARGLVAFADVTRYIIAPCKNALAAWLGPSDKKNFLDPKRVELRTILWLLHERHACLLAIGSDKSGTPFLKL